MRRGSSGHQVEFSPFICPTFAWQVRFGNKLSSTTPQKGVYAFIFNQKNRNWVIK
jgi:hypothetical protein